MKNIIYLVSADLTFYFKDDGRGISQREVNLLYQYADYIYTQNEYGHWQFIKNRSVGLDGYDFFERKDLIDAIPLNSSWARRESLYRARIINSNETARAAIGLWLNRKEQLTDSRYQ